MSCLLSVNIRPHFKKTLEFVELSVCTVRTSLAGFPDTVPAALCTENEIIEIDDH